MLLVLAACEPPLPDALGECPTDSAIGWTDVSPIFTEHCTGCHSSELEGDDRNGAPELVDFDAPGDLGVESDLLWSQIWTGSMPFGGPPLDEDEAWIVWEWLSCDQPL